MFVILFINLFFSPGLVLYLFTIDIFSSHDTYVCSFLKIGGVDFPDAFFSFGVLAVFDKI